MMSIRGFLHRWRWLLAAAALLVAFVLLSRSAVVQGLMGTIMQQPQQDGTWPELATVEPVSGLLQPVHITHAGDGSERLFIVEQSGRIRIVQDGTLQPEPLLDITDRVACCGERGLLSVAFPPDYASKGYFYVNYTRQPDGATVIARFRLVAGSANRADPDSEEEILTIAQPFPNHNGGQLAFGPDGYLYIGMGDGGSGGDPQNNAQTTSVLLGKLLRIDVEAGTQPYAIPATNPFADDPNYRGEIWALGLRNPWRFSFDRETDDLYIADVGQNAWEEVNMQPAGSTGGENYGWRCKEATHDFDLSAAPCDDAGFVASLVAPVQEYTNGQGDCSVTGGFVYRGAEYERMQGVYFYADYCSGKIWGLRRDGTGWSNMLLLDENYTMTTFGEDEAGNLYVADYSSGRILKLIDASPPGPDTGVITRTLNPGASTSLPIRDDALTIDLEFPARAVSSTTLISYTTLPVTPTVEELPADSTPLYRFRLEAVAASGLPLLQFDEPFSLTIQGLAVPTATLDILVRSSQGQLAPCQQCVLDVVGQQITLRTDQAGEFVLIRHLAADERRRIFLPIIRA